MAFRPPRKIPQFADLKAILAQTKETEDPLYQVVQEIIERLSTVQFDALAVGAGTETGGGGTGAETFLTKLNELATLPNSSRLLARNSITFDDSTPAVRNIDLDLEYSGDYVAGPTYVDGDIIVGPDQVAYICVRPTNTPPVPWPGIGIISSIGPAGPPGATGPPGPKGDKGDPGTGAVVDAKYWVVEPHPDLANERALSLLTNGYVKSTGGEPSTIQVIPVSEGGTGATIPLTARANLGLATVAYKDQNNIFQGQNEFQGYTIFSNAPAQFGPTIVTANPTINFYETDQAANHHYKRIFVDADSFSFQSVNDAYTVSSLWATISAFGMVLGPTGLNPIFADGSGLINLNATQLTTGTVPLPRLGISAPAVGQFLAWDNTWRTPPSAAAFPSGLIVLSDTPCPVGWTRVNFDGSFLRVNSSAGGMGGAATHQHGAGTLATANHNHGGSTGLVSVVIGGNTGNGGSHSHHFSFHVGGTTSGGIGGVNTADGGTSFQTNPTTHTHTFGADIDANTDPVGDHQHSFSGSGSGTGSIPAEVVGIGGLTATASSLPPYIDIILCRKD